MFGELIRNDKTHILSKLHHDNKAFQEILPLKKCLRHSQETNFESFCKYINYLSVTNRCLCFRSYHSTCL